MQPVTLLCIAVQLPCFHSDLASSPPPAHSCICEVDSIGRIRSAGQRRPPDGDTLQPAGTLAQKTLGNKGSRGVFYEATQVFVPGTTGSEWPEPEFDDLERFNSAQLEASSKIEVRLLALFSLPSNACVPRAAPPAGSVSRPWNRVGICAPGLIDLRPTTPRAAGLADHLVGRCRLLPEYARQFDLGERGHRCSPSPSLGLTDCSPIGRTSLIVEILQVR